MKWNPDPHVITCIYYKLPLAPGTHIVNTLPKWHTCTCTYIHTYTNSPTITPPSLSYLLFPCCFSMLSLSLMKLLTCGVIGVIRSYNILSLFLKHCRKQNIHVSPKKPLSWHVCSSMNRTKEEFDDAARPPLRKFIADPIICLKAAQWAAAVIVKPGHDLATSAVRPVDTFQPAWRAQKKVWFCGTCIPFDLNHWGPLCCTCQILNHRL